MLLSTWPCTELVFNCCNTSSHNPVLVDIRRKAQSSCLAAASSSVAQPLISRSSSRYAACLSAFLTSLLFAPALSLVYLSICLYLVKTSSFVELLGYQSVHSCQHFSSFGWRKFDSRFAKDIDQVLLCFKSFESADNRHFPLFGDSTCSQVDRLNVGDCRITTLSSWGHSRDGASAGLSNESVFILGDNQRLG